LFINITRVVTVGAAFSLIASVGAIVFSVSNQSLRQEVAERQQVINQGLALSQVNTRLVNSLAALAARDNDAQIHALLAQQGITYSTNPVPHGQGAPPQAQQPVRTTK
jgi:hypothetical protein